MCIFQLHYVSSSIHSKLKQAAKEVVPKVFGLLPDGASAEGMSVEARVQYMREKVAYWKGERRLRTGRGMLMLLSLREECRGAYNIHTDHLGRLIYVMSS